jgi:hypothetical protein
LKPLGADEDSIGIHCPKGGGGSSHQCDRSGRKLLHSSRQADCAPHWDAAGNHTELFNNNNHRVWTLLVKLTRSHLCWTYIKGFARARDGRAAFLKLREHYLGINNVNNMASKAKKTIAKLVYTKEGKRWNFEASGHKEQHQILEQLEKDYGYKCMDKGTKVRHLIAGIQTDKLETIKGQILGTPTLQHDFDGCVNLFKAFLQQVAKDRGQTSMGDRKCNPPPL